MKPAKLAGFPHEHHVKLRECLIQWTILQTQDVIRNEAFGPHVFHDFTEERSLVEKLKHGNLQKHQLCAAEYSGPTGQDVEFRPLHVNLEEIGRQSFLVHDQTVEGDRPYLALNAIDIGAFFNLSIEGRSDKVMMDVDADDLFFGRYSGNFIARTWEFFCDFRKRRNIFPQRLDENILGFWENGMTGSRKRPESRPHIYHGRRHKPCCSGLYQTAFKRRSLRPVAERGGSGVSMNLKPKSSE